MRRLTALSLAAFTLAACAKEEPKPDTTAAAAAAPAPPPAPTPINLADVAGKWQMVALTEKGDTVRYLLDAKADTLGWMATFPKRKPMSVHVIPGGDSIVAHMGPYESVLRKGVQVTTENVYRLKDGKLMSTAVAHYKGAGADSVVKITAEGTRQP
jgi:hypothetical protein